MPYIGHSPTNAGTFYILDSLTMSSSTTYTMQVGSIDVTPNVDNLLITLDGVIQHPSTAYTVSGSTLTFDTAPGAGVEFYGVVMGQSASFGEGSIGADELKVTGDGSSGQVLASDGDGTFTWTTDTENYLPLAGGTMSGAINLGSQNVTNGGTITGTFVGGITGNVTGNTSGSALTVTQAAQTAITSVGTLTALTVDDITINGSTISDSGDFTLDVGGTIILDGDTAGDNIHLKDSGTHYGSIVRNNSDLEIRVVPQDEDIVFRGNDGGSQIDALKLDMSAGGAATFTGTIANTGLHTVTQSADHDGIRFRGYDDSNSYYGKIGITDVGYTQIFAEGNRSIDLKSGRQIRFFTSTDNSTYNNSVNFNSDGSATFAGDVRIGATSITASGDKSEFVVQSASHGGMSALGPDATEQGFFTGHASSNRVGEFHTRYDTNTMTIGSAKSGMQVLLMSGARATALTLDSSQNATFAGAVKGERHTLMDGATTCGQFIREETITGAGSSQDVCLFAETGLDLHFMTGGSVTKVLTLDTSNNATFAGNISAGVGTFSGAINIPNFQALKQTNFGYSTSYWVLQLGALGTQQTISLGVDPSANTSGAFNGHGAELIIKNPYTFIQPNDANNGWHSIVSFSDGVATFASNIVQNSDEILKDNVQTISGGLSKVNQLRGVSFTRNDLEDTEKVHLGVIAQEVEAVLPEVVSEIKNTDRDGNVTITKGVAYTTMVAVLIEAVKELSSENDDLKSRITALENA